MEKTKHLQSRITVASHMVLDAVITAVTAANKLSLYTNNLKQQISKMFTNNMCHLFYDRMGSLKIYYPLIVTVGLDQTQNYVSLFGFCCSTGIFKYFFPFLLHIVLAMTVVLWDI